MLYFPDNNFLSSGYRLGHYNNKLSETTDLENISKLTEVCPQSNVQFDFLTVKENLRLFAKIKGIQPHEVDNEVHNMVEVI